MVLDYTNSKNNEYTNKEVRRSKDGLSRKYVEYFPKQRDGAHSRLYNWKLVPDC